MLMCILACFEATVQWNTAWNHKAILAGRVFHVTFWGPVRESKSRGNSVEIWWICARMWTTETRVLWCHVICGCVDCSSKASDSLRVKDTAERIVVPEILSASERYILLFWGLLVVLWLLAMAEEKQILLDRKVLSLDLESVRKFAIQAKVDKSDL